MRAQQCRHYRVDRARQATGVPNRENLDAIDLRNKADTGGIPIVRKLICTNELVCADIGERKLRRHFMRETFVRDLAALRPTVR